MPHQIPVNFLTRPSFIEKFYHISYLDLLLSVKRVLNKVTVALIVLAPLILPVTLCHPRSAKIYPSGLYDISEKRFSTYHIGTLINQRMWPVTIGTKYIVILQE